VSRAVSLTPRVYPRSSRALSWPGRRDGARGDGRACSWSPACSSFRTTASWRRSSSRLAGIGSWRRWLTAGR